ncbi:uncharacterized protein LOC115728194 isoform X1 [Rhodamnia argentea]|uniref:Uncharacterized protein LOC115728194 isoform X1 n=1 Tax=Rhodamnia argentea TaxID=178133 RepID=A0ABM3HIP3_9MYRT|nr:uncharacterized protein LOC115728194 isoform X1 [Rhodamnia argentea]
MEEAAKEQSTGSGKPKLLRYGLRSAAKSKEEKHEAASSSSSRRTRPSPSVSKSMGVLDLSGKEKSAKPPRRLSIPTKSSVNPAPKSGGNVSPISEARVRRPANSQAKNETPLSTVSRSSVRKKYNLLSSTSYWLSQINLSESDNKHSISLGFFKLASEAGCEPIQKMREELKSYAQRHNLAEYGESLKELFETYNIAESMEQMQVSETCSQEPEEETRTSDDDVHSSVSVTGARKLKPKSMNDQSAQTSPVAESAKESKTKTATKIREPVSKNSASSKTFRDREARNLQKKPQKSVKQEVNKEKVKKQAGKLAAEEGQNKRLPAEDNVENKENMDAGPVKEPSAVV